MEVTRFHTYRWRRVYRRATNECAVPPLDIGVWAIQLSPYRVGVAGPCHTRLLTSPAFRPCCCSLALSGLGEAVASESSALNSGLLRKQFAPCVTWRTVSPHLPVCHPGQVDPEGVGVSRGRSLERIRPDCHSGRQFLCHPRCLAPGVPGSLQCCEARCR